MGKYKKNLKSTKENKHFNIKKKFRQTFFCKLCGIWQMRKSTSILQPAIGNKFAFFSKMIALSTVTFVINTFFQLKKCSFEIFRARPASHSRGGRNWRSKGKFFRARTCFCKLCQDPQNHWYFLSMRRTQWKKKLKTKLDSYL